MKAAIIVFPGSNREGDVRDALVAVTGTAPLMVWHRDTELPKVDLIVVPGGFSYGDYLRCGAIAAHSPVMREVKARADKGAAVLGICNGFQILTETGMLPGALLRNAGLAFVCRNVTLRVENTQTLFTAAYNQGQELSVPVAHHDGNYFADASTLDRLESNGQIAFRYVDNPNGSVRDIAGIFNETKNVLGLMPHPENATDGLLGSTDGLPLFRGMVEALA
ncbi:MAG: phosphoribosylformylglycinamidine synthase subunit PurQ [Rhodospirillaceae bacterium]|nr:phosphoribosylformylglycinamidine synthase subunit PurQ [Rhodospirillaceae bacterium]